MGGQADNRAEDGRATNPISDKELIDYMQKYDRIRGATDFRFIYGVTF